MNGCLCRRGCQVCLGWCTPTWAARWTRNCSAGALCVSAARNPLPLHRRMTRFTSLRPAACAPKRAWVLTHIAIFSNDVSYNGSSRCSDWEARPLSVAQQHYAAADAVCLLPLLDTLAVAAPPERHPLNCSIPVRAPSCAYGCTKSSPIHNEWLTSGWCQLPLSNLRTVVEMAVCPMCNKWCKQGHHSNCSPC